MIFVSFPPLAYLPDAKTDASLTTLVSVFVSEDAPESSESDKSDLADIHRHWNSSLYQWAKLQQNIIHTCLAESEMKACVKETLRTRF